MPEVSVEQVMVHRVITTHFRACAAHKGQDYHPECPNCITYQTAVAACSNPNHRDGKCPVCNLIDGRLAGVSAKEEISLITRVRSLFRKR